MHLFLTSVLPLLAHDHASAAAFLTCRHHNFHASIIPEFLSDEDRVRKFCSTRQQNQIKADQKRQYANWYNLFVQTPLMQFSPSLVLRDEVATELILKPLLETKYFTRTLQRYSVLTDRSQPLTSDFLQALSKVQSLNELSIGVTKDVLNEHLEIIINSFLGLETLTIGRSRQLKVVDPSVPAINVSSPPPLATKTLRNLRLAGVDALLVAQFVPHFPNLRKLELSAQFASQELDLRVLSASLPLLINLTLESFALQYVEAIKDLAHVSSLEFRWCRMTDFSFLTQQNSLPNLRTLRIDDCGGFSTSSFASLAHAPNLHVLKIVSLDFDNNCLQFLENMIHLRKLDLTHSKISGDSRSLKTLMQNLFQLEELNLHNSHDLGNQGGAVSGALYITESCLRVLNLSDCNLVDDDLKGIGALKNTLEVLQLEGNWALTGGAIVHCKSLINLKILKLDRCDGIDDVSPLADCAKLEELTAAFGHRLTDDSFKVFSEDPHSFPNLSVLHLAHCEKLTEKVFEHLSNNNNLVYQLKELNLEGDLCRIVPSPSSTAWNSICHFKGLRRLNGIFSHCSGPVSDRNKVKGEMMQSLKNLEEVR